MGIEDKTIIKEIEKIPQSIQNDMMEEDIINLVEDAKKVNEDKKQENIENIEEEIVVDWFGINELKKEISISENQEVLIEENEDKIIENENKDKDINHKKYIEETVEKVEENKKTLYSLFYENILNIFHKTDDNNEDITSIKNIKIKEGIIYSRTVQDIIDSNILILKNNLCVIIPHLEDEVNMKNKKLLFQYLLHNGDWWVCLKVDTKFEDIKFNKFILEEQLNYQDL